MNSLQVAGESRRRRDLPSSKKAFFDFLRDHQETDLKQWVEAAVKVRFEEVDPWQIVWYGNYLSYFEVARTALLEKFDLLAGAITDLGFRTPVVDLKTRFKSSARFNDLLLVRSTVRVPETASLTFDFEIHRPADQALIALGETTQVLLSADGKMIYRFSGPLQDRVDRMVSFCNPPC